MGDSLNLGKVRTDKPELSPQPIMFPANAVEAMAILTIHGELEKDENGIGIMTLRQLCETCAPRLDGLLREYVCAFGQHGKTVITRYIGMMVMNARGGDEEALRIKTEFNQRVDDAIREFKPRVANYLRTHPETQK